MTTKIKTDKNRNFLEVEGDIYTVRHRVSNISPTITQIYYRKNRG